VDLDQRRVVEAGEQPLPEVAARSGSTRQQIVCGED